MRKAALQVAMGIAWLGGFGAVCAMAVVPAAAASPASPPPAPAVAQELTVGDLGMGAQTVSGARGLAEVYFPPPATKLAPVGSFVRVFFAHTRDPANGSTMLVSVNSQPLDVVHLSPGTAGGGVVDVPVPTNALDERQPNRLQVRFGRLGGAVGRDPVDRGQAVVAGEEPAGVAPERHGTQPADHFGGLLYCYGVGSQRADRF